VPSHLRDQDLSPAPPSNPARAPPEIRFGPSHSAHRAPSGNPPALRSMHLCGITAEDRPGAPKNRSPVNSDNLDSYNLSPVSRFP